MAKFREFFRIVHIHPILIIFIFISIVTGTFSQLIIMLSIVFIHEMGHFFAAVIFKWRIEKVIFWVFGGVMISSDYGVRKIKEDIIVTLAGPLQHVFIFFILQGLLSFQIVPASVVEMGIFYNKILLLFNLLPVFPLDGGKLFFYVLSIFIPYRKAHRFILLFSLISCIAIILMQVFVLPFTLSAFILIVFLYLENRSEWKNQYYIFIRFLLNRFHSNREQFKKMNLFVSPSERLINIFTQFRRSKDHDINVNYFGKVQQISEVDTLYLYFKKEKFNETIGEILEECDISKES